MNKNAYRGHRFPPAIIQVTVWMYARFTLSLRDVEELLAERGLDISYETVRRWFLKFGQVYARSIRQRRHRPTDRWYLDEMVIVMGRRRFYLWRAVDSEGEVLDFLVQRRRNTRAAERLMRKLLKRQGFAPSPIVTDKLGSYGAVHAAVYNLFNIDRHLTSRRTMKEFRGQAFRQWKELAAAA